MSGSSQLFFNQIEQRYFDTKAEQSLFRLAVAKMAASLDPLHDERHIEAMLKLFEHLEEQKKLSLSRFEKKCAVLSIAWHDVWISGHTPSFFLRMWWDQMYEGIACAKLFRKHAQLLELAEDQIQACTYAIRKHSNYQLFELNTAIARILHDLDWLEFYSVKRVAQSAKILKKRGKRLFFEWSWFHVALSNLYMKLRSHNQRLFYHDWAKERFAQIQTEFFTYVHRLQDEAKKNSYFNPILKFF